MAVLLNNRQTVRLHGDNILQIANNPTRFDIADLVFSQITNAFCDGDGFQGADVEALRIRQMEKIVVIPYTNGAGALPSDIVAPISFNEVDVEGSDILELGDPRYINPSELRRRSGRFVEFSGFPYSLEGNTILWGSSRTASGYIRITYYAAPQSLPLTLDDIEDDDPWADIHHRLPYLPAYLAYNYINQKNDKQALYWWGLFMAKMKMVNHTLGRRQYKYSGLLRARPPDSFDGRV